MIRDNDNSKNSLDILYAFFDSLGGPADVAKEIDDIIFDWIGSNDQDLQDWHKNKIHTLKSVRDLFTALNSAAD